MVTPSFYFYKRYIYLINSDYSCICVIFLLVGFYLLLLVCLIASYHLITFCERNSIDSDHPGVATAHINLSWEENTKPCIFKRLYVNTLFYHVSCNIKNLNKKILCQYYKSLLKLLAIKIRFRTFIYYLYYSIIFNIIFKQRLILIIEIKIAYWLLKTRY